MKLIENNGYLDFAIMRNITNTQKHKALVLVHRNRSNFINL